MSNAMPVIMSSSPPPIDDCDEEEDDEFGDFRVADLSFSLTDLNQPSDSLENVKHWIEPTIKTNENELQNSDIPISDSVPNHISSSAISNNLEDSQLDLLKNDSKPNGTPLDAIDSSFLEEGSPNIPASDFLVQCPDTKNVSMHKNKIINFKDINSDPVLVNEVKESVSGSGIDYHVNEDEVNGEILRTDNLGNFGGTREESNIISDDFNDFADFTSGSDLTNFQNATNNQKPVLNVIDATDDFDDFDDFESAEFKSCPAKEEWSTVEETLKMMFENPNENNSWPDMAEITDSLHLCLDDSSSVWGHLKELETSHALSYQWSNSTANKTLLSSLNIDCRNIIFGARWNLCVPRFAANLGVNPLEPVRAVETTFSPVNAAASTSSVEDVVPAAQFDWTGSGLTNPLDASQLTLVDLDFFTKFDDISLPSHAASSFWNFPSLEKENASSAAESTVPSVVETPDVEPVKPVIDDIFGSISNEVMSKEAEEESVILPTPISSVPEMPQKKMSAEAYMVVESFPDLSFLSARKLLHAADENMSRWRVKP